MKTKYFFVLLIVALFAAIAVPALAGHAPKDPTRPATGVLISFPTHDAQEPRLWSGEIYNSDSNNPDYTPNPSERIQGPVNTPDNTCASEDAHEQKYGGCIE